MAVRARVRRTEGGTLVCERHPSPTLLYISCLLLCRGQTTQGHRALSSDVMPCPLLCRVVELSCQPRRWWCRKLLTCPTLPCALRPQLPPRAADSRASRLTTQSSGFDMMSRRATHSAIFFRVYKIKCTGGRQAHTYLQARRLLGTVAQAE